MIKREILKKFNKSPGQCTLEEVQEVKTFLIEVAQYRDLFVDVYGDEPIGLTLEHRLIKLDWYIYFKKENQKQQTSINIVNASDPRKVSQYLNTNEGENTIINVLSSKEK